MGDNLDLLRDRIFENLKNVDVFVTTGGVSTGQEDFVSKFLNRECHVLNWRIAIKPGRPFICAKLGAKYVFGLPGNPVAAFICALIILRPSLGRIGGEKAWFKPFSFKARANFKKHKRPGRIEFLRAKMNEEDGFVSIYPFEGSGRLSSLSWSSGIVELDESEQIIEKGDSVIMYGVQVSARNRINLYFDGKEHPESEIGYISLDKEKHNRKAISFINSNNWTFDSYLEPNAKSIIELKGQNVPFILVLNESGKIVYRTEGYDSNTLNKIEEELIKISNK